MPFRISEVRDLEIMASIMLTCSVAPESGLFKNRWVEAKWRGVAVVLKFEHLATSFGWNFRTSLAGLHICFNKFLPSKIANIW